MVTLGSIQPSTFQAFHGSTQSYDDTLSFHTLQLALNDVGPMTSSSNSFGLNSASGSEDRALGQLAPARSMRCGSVSVMSVPDQSPGLSREQAGRSTSIGGPQYMPSVTHRLFRTAKPEPTDSSWQEPCSPSKHSKGLGVDGNTDGDSTTGSWRTTNVDVGVVSKPPGLSIPQHSDGKSFGLRSPASVGRGSIGEDRRPQNEILDGSDVLQQISNLTSTEPSNEREVFVGGLRESEDAVHITEEELATYFSKFGVIESVSINRDDRTHRGRGFAFVKFFQESAALNAVVADASTHVIRGTTVSVQWSRGAKDGGGDRPRRRGSNTSATSSGSPSRGSTRSSPKMSVFSSGGGQKGSGGHRGAGVNSCGAGCSHGYSPHRSRSQGHLHAGPLGSLPSSYQYSDHPNQQMVCVVVPAQRAAALGLAHHPAHSLASSGPRGSPPGDTHYIPVAPGTGGHSSGGNPSHIRSHSHTPSSSSNGHNSGGGVGGYGHYVPSEHHSHAFSVAHHHGAISQNSVSSLSGHSSSHSYGGHGHAHAAPMHMPPVHQQYSSSTRQPRQPQQRSRGRGESRGQFSTHSSIGVTRHSPQSSYTTEYDRTQLDLPTSHANSYPPQGWRGDDLGSASMRYAALRSQSPPLMHNAQSRSGGGAPRPPPPPPRGYESQYSRYTPPPPGHASALDGFPAGTSTTGRRHSGSSAMSSSRANGGISSGLRHDCLGGSALLSSTFYSSPTAGEIGSERLYDHEYTYTGPSRMP